MLFSYLIH